MFQAPTLGFSVSGFGLQALTCCARLLIYEWGECLKKGCAPWRVAQKHLKFVHGSASRYPLACAGHLRPIAQLQ